MIWMFKNPYKIGLSLLFTETLLTAIELQSISETNGVALVWNGEERNAAIMLQ